jgi:hypothetical protein
MGLYFNKGRTPIAATLGDGSSIAFPPKKWIELTKQQEGAAQVIRYVRKGKLVYREAPVEPAAEAPVKIVETPDPKVPDPEKIEPSPTVILSDHVVALASVEEKVSKTFSDPDDNVVASEDESDAESKTTRRSKTRRR